MGEFRIEAGRVALRAWRAGDRRRFAAMLNTPATTRHLGGPASPAQVDALFLRRLTDQARDGISYWAVELRATGELIGSAGLRIARNYPGTPVLGMLEAGWRIAEAWQRQGLAHEAMTAAIAWAWSHRNDAEIGAWARPENTPSLTLMRRLGFVRRAEHDFLRPATAEACLVHVLPRPVPPGIMP